MSQNITLQARESEMEAVASNFVEFKKLANFSKMSSKPVTTTKSSFYVLGLNGGGQQYLFISNKILEELGTREPSVTQLMSYPIYRYDYNSKKELRVRKTKDGKEVPDPIYGFGRNSSAGAKMVDVDIDAILAEIKAAEEKAAQGATMTTNAGAGVPA